MATIQGECKLNVRQRNNESRTTQKIPPQIEFERNYDDDEDKMRFKLFVDTIAEINKHNEKFARGLVEVAAGLNEYSDWSDEEKQKLLRWGRINIR